MIGHESTAATWDDALLKLSPPELDSPGEIHSAEPLVLAPPNPLLLYPFVG